MNRQRLERLFDDWPAKMLSIAGAIAVFFFYQFNRLEARPLSLPLAVSYGAELVPGNALPRNVRLTLRGEANEVFSVNESDLTATLDLRAYTAPGVYRVPVSIERQGTALDIDPLEIDVDPVDLAVSLERRVVREIPVVPSLRGYLEPGFELASFDIVPSRMEAAGPASVMATLVDASTEPIELSGRSGDFSVRVRVPIRNPLVRLVSAETVEFSARIRRALVYRSFENQPLVFEGLAAGLHLATPPETGAMKVSSDSVTLDSFTPVDDLLVVDLSGIKKPGTYTVPVTTRVPEGFTVESWQPRELLVEIRSGDAPGPVSSVLPVPATGTVPQGGGTP